MAVLTSFTGCNNLFVMETLDSEKLAQNLNNTWEKMEKAESLNVMVQVNTSQEASKFDNG